MYDEKEVKDLGYNPPASDESSYDDYGLPKYAGEEKNEYGEYLGKNYSNTKDGRQNRFEDLENLVHDIYPQDNNPKRNLLEVLNEDKNNLGWSLENYLLLNEDGKPLGESMYSNILDKMDNLGYDTMSDELDKKDLLDEIPIFLEDGTFNSDNPRASERMNEIEKYLFDYGIESPTDVYNHLLDSGYSDKDISEIVDNDYISDYDIMEGITSHADLGERALYGMTPREMLGDRVSNWIDYDMLKRDLEYDVEDMWRDYQNENGITDDMDNYYDGYDDYYNEIEDEFIQNAGEELDNYFDYDKFGYDLSMSDYYYDEDSGIASRNN